MSTANPLADLISDWLGECDFAVFNHGFLGHGRDYAIVVQGCVGPVSGTHKIVFTHVVSARCRTAVSAEAWTSSWDDVFLDYEAAKDLDGYIWGTDWSLAYPGLEAADEDAEAKDWTRRLGHPMHCAVLRTDRFELRLVFHAIRVEQLSDDTSVIEQAIHPI